MITRRKESAYQQMEEANEKAQEIISGAQNEAEKK